jgi:hypothetical protein
MIGVMLAVAAPLLLLLPIGSGLKLAIGAGVLAFSLKGALRVVMERMRAEGEVRGYAIVDVAITGGGLSDGHGPGRRRLGRRRAAGGVRDHGRGLPGVVLAGTGAARGRRSFDSARLKRT